eukprot:8334403-Heterocapsa_arctica.AAC.1
MPCGHARRQLQVRGHFAGFMRHAPPPGSDASSVLNLLRGLNMPGRNSLATECRIAGTSSTGSSE